MGDNRIRYNNTSLRKLLNCPANMEVDHINGDISDNRVENIRIVTSQQNKMNRTARKNKKSGLPKGVFLDKRDNRYYAQIRIHSTGYNLGRFSSVERAEEAYKKAAEKYFGEFAVHKSRD